MVSDLFVIDIDKALKKKRLPDIEIFKFYEEVNKCMEDSSWLRQHKLNPNNRDKEIVKRILYNQLYQE